jgi:hypothetical protein
MAMYTTPSPSPVEHVGRGAVAALLVVPLGVTAWVLIANVGIFVSIISFAVAWGAFSLYRLGAGGVISRKGAVVVTIITLGTVLLSIFATIVAEVAIGLGKIAGVSPFAALLDDQFWPTFNHLMAVPEVQSGLVPDVLIGLAIGILGCFSTLRNALRATAPAQVSSAQQSTESTPIAPEDQAKN